MFFMKKFIAIILILSIVFCFFSCQKKSNPPALAKTDVEIAQGIKKLMYSQNYEEIYQQVGMFLNSENCEKIINETYKSVFECSKSEFAFSRINALYDSALICTGRYDSFTASFNENKIDDQSYMEDYFESLWKNLIATNKAPHSFDMNKLTNLISNIYSGIELDTFIYYLNMYFNIENSDELTNNVVKSENYNERRTQYVLTLLASENNYDEFKRIFSNEYIYEPFTGLDIMYFIQNANFSSEQQDILYQALEELRTVFQEKKPNLYKLKKGIINNLQDLLHVSSDAVAKFDVKTYQAFIDSYAGEESTDHIESPTDAKVKAEKILTEIYGSDIKAQKPFTVLYDDINKVWLIEGTWPYNNMDDGIAHILIEESTGKILAVWQGNTGDGSLCFADN